MFGVFDFRAFGVGVSGSGLRVSGLGCWVLISSLQGSMLIKGGALFTCLHTATYTTHQNPSGRHSQEPALIFF